MNFPETPPFSPEEVLAKSKVAAAKPAVDQMWEINRLGMSVAVAQGKLKKGRKDNAHIFLPHEHEVFEAPDENGMRYSTRRFVGRIAKVGWQRWSMRVVEAYWMRGIDDEGLPDPEKMSTAELRERLLCPDETNIDEMRDKVLNPKLAQNQDGYRVSYMFEWSPSGVMYACRRFNVVHKQPAQILDSRKNSLDNPRDPEALHRELEIADALGRNGQVHPEMIVAAEQIKQVSQADCNLLIADMSEFHKVSMEKLELVQGL